MSDDLVEFLNARLDEDAAGEQTWVDVCDSNFNIKKVPGNVVPPSPRMLAEVEAKRRILELAPSPDLWRDDGNGDEYCDENPAWELWMDTLKALASVYANHPDYRPEWGSTNVRAAL